MGDSTCLMQPFCYASGITNEANESNPIHALGQSVSFGRFMSEPLSWEKWSSFPHNRYVEEAERYSKPGSVAQKKAFFEAHYKKIAAQKAAAAALLEQENNATGQQDDEITDNSNSNAHNSETSSPKNAIAAQNNATGQEDEEAVVYNSNSNVHNLNTTSLSSDIIIAQGNATGQEDEGVVVVDDNSSAYNDSDITKPNSKTVVKEEEDALLRGIGHYSDSNVEASVVIPQSNKVEKAEPEMEQEALLGNSLKIEFINKLEDVNVLKEQTEKISVTPPIMTPILKQGSNSNQEVSASISKKKLPVSSFKLLKGNGTSKVTSTPVKSTAPNSSKRDNIATPMSNNKHAALSSADKKRSTPKSLQMPINFTPIRELNRLTASVMRKFENARVGAGSSKASKDTLTPLRTPTMASKKEMQKHFALTPLTEKRRNKTPVDLSATGNHTARRKWRLLSTEDKMRSPVISSPFSLRTEERAARRKKKLEEKFNDNEAQKVQLHTKLKEKAETEIRKLRQSFCFKARPLPDFYKERKSSNHTKKDPLTHSESPKERRKTTPSVVVESKTSLPPHIHKPLLKNNGTKNNFMGKSSGRTLAHHLNTNSMITTTNHENTSPNIQKLNLGGTNYKY